jgi:hypothetical protein
MALSQRARKLFATGAVSLLTASLLTAINVRSADAQGASGGKLGPDHPPATAARWQTGASAGKPTNRPPRAAIAGMKVAPDGEVPALRTRFSETFRRAGGAMETRFSSAPLHFRRSGQWHTIDETLVPHADGSVTNAADQMTVSFPALATGATTATEGSHFVSMTSVGVAAVPVQSEGSTATYAETYPGIDQLFTVAPDTVEETYRIKTGVRWTPLRRP